MKFEKISVGDYGFFAEDAGKEWSRRGLWNAWWIGAGEADDYAAVYRLEFELEHRERVRIHVTADPAYLLFVDGEWRAAGPELGDRLGWHVDTYELELAGGKHRIEAEVPAFGTPPMTRKMSCGHGFLLAAEGEFSAIFDTGRGDWQCRKRNGVSFRPGSCWAAGLMGGELHFRPEKQAEMVWHAPRKLYPGADYRRSNDYRWPRVLRPGTLPQLLRNRLEDVTVLQAAAGTDHFWSGENGLPEERERFRAFLGGDALFVIEKNTSRRFLLRFSDYHCAWPRLRVSGGEGSRIHLDWAESLFEEDNQLGRKGDREAWEGKYFIGYGDHFYPNGERCEFLPHHWKSGRYLSLTVETGAEALTLEELTFTETGYPLRPEASFRSSDARLDELAALCIRTLRMCSHDTFVDCPYYEQLMYAGDTRLQILLTYTLTGDDRLARKAIELFSRSRLPDGFLQSRYPSNSLQIIPGFSLFWIGMLHDASRWREFDPAAYLPTAQGVLEAFEPYAESGLIGKIRTWNFFDWVPGWEGGVPPQGEEGPCCCLNLLWCNAAVQLAELYAEAGRPETAAGFRRRARERMRNTVDCFWDAEAGLFADTPDHLHFSEHAQCLAVLGGLLEEDRFDSIRTRIGREGISRTTVYFSHYLFEAARKLKRPDLIFDRLELWYSFRGMGLKTLLEAPEPSRSDCHAWSSHPLFHCYATILGIRPGAAGFRRVDIEPCLGGLTEAAGCIPHPSGGMISVSIARRSEGTAFRISLPPGIPGVLHWQGRQIPFADSLECEMPASRPERASSPVFAFDRALSGKME